MDKHLETDSIEIKRLFFAFEISAPWPGSLPSGRVLKENNRHMTAVFLGNVDFNYLSKMLLNAPIPSLHVGLTGQFDKVIFLPKNHPRVVAWHVFWLDDVQKLIAYVRSLISWLQEAGFTPDVREEFLPHVTICRAPFEFEEWRHAFEKLPMALTNLHLYESLGNLEYRSLWSQKLVPPFEELEHTADIAFSIHGENVHQLYLHALTALAFKCPELLKYRKEEVSIAGIDDVVRELNFAVAHTDAAIGCPFKAVSYHGEIKQKTNGLLAWEMIVDV